MRSALEKVKVSAPAPVVNCSMLEKVVFPYPAPEIEPAPADVRLTVRAEAASAAE